MLRIHVTNESQDERFVHQQGPLEFGRVKRADWPPRFVIGDQTVSRDQVMLEETPDGRGVRVRNLSNSQPISVDDGSTLDTGQERVIPLPTALSFGMTLLEIDPAASASTQTADQEGYLTIAQPVKSGDVTAGIGSSGGSGVLPLLPVLGGARQSGPTTLDAPTRMGGGSAPMMPTGSGRPSSGAATAINSATMVGGHAAITTDSGGLENMARWLETVMALQRAASTNADFYADTARVLVEMIGLDLGMVLLRTDDGTSGWQIASRHAPTDSGAVQRFSRTVLNRVVAHRRTFYQDFAESNTIASLQNAEAVVASPIFGVSDEVIGILYGMRALNLRQMQLGIKPLQAQLVQLLAAAVGAAMARIAAVRTRTQFESFFSPELVRELERDPKLLEGRDQEVTILVSDLRGFTALSERLAAKDTIALIHDLMEALSNRIAELGGVIVDYAGDGILAMWNAPVTQPDHAARAARAALLMQGEMPALNAKWQPRIGGELNLGVGINTGACQVGNTGSSRKLKYGPHGYNVNLASRVQDTTKKLGVPLVISGSARTNLPTSFLTRRICKARLAGILTPVDLHEMVGETPPSPDWLSRRDTYEATLAAFEAGRFIEAGSLIRQLLPTQDKPILNLARRVRDVIKEPPAAFDPVLDLTAK